MIITGPDDVTDVVLAAMAGAPNPRMRHVMESLVRHLHDFARETQLTEEEWETGIAFITGLGKKTTDSHNETILASDSVGLSTLVCLMNNGQDGSTETASAVLGPFWRMHSPPTENGASIVRSDTPGLPVFVEAMVRDTAGKPIADVEIDVWHSSPVGMYENQDPTQIDMNLRGKFRSDADGRISFRSVLPAGYPVPIDGPVGQLLAAQKRRHFRPAHLHFLLFKDGFKTLVTQIFVSDDPDIENDVVFGVTRALIGDYQRHESGSPPAADVAGPWYTLQTTLVMSRGEARLPVPPIA